ncbi:hypothetical protein EV424DRAFT_1348567 [Suillus variegatus]|nr:hypothetical protein EV424DRAFT_1348567 [Suillus variegatus]
MPQQMKDVDSWLVLFLCSVCTLQRWDNPARNIDNINKSGKFLNSDDLARETVIFGKTHTSNIVLENSSSQILNMASRAGLIQRTGDETLKTSEIINTRITSIILYDIPSTQPIKDEVLWAHCKT